MFDLIYFCHEIRVQSLGIFLHFEEAASSFIEPIIEIIDDFL